MNVKTFPAIGDTIIFPDAYGVVTKLVPDVDGQPAAAVVKIEEGKFRALVNMDVTQLNDDHWFVVADHNTGERFELPSKAEGSARQ